MKSLLRLQKGVALGGKRVALPPIRMFSSLDSDELVFYENLGPRKNKGMLLATGWSLLTTCTFCYFQYIHVPPPADASIFVKIISSESWNFAGILLGPIIVYGNKKYGNYLVADMKKSGTTLTLRTHNFLGFPNPSSVRKHEVKDFILEGYGKQNDLLEYRIENAPGVRYIFNREPHVETLLSKTTTTPSARPQQQTDTASSKFKRGGGLKRVH